MMTSLDAFLKCRRSDPYLHQSEKLNPDPDPDPHLCQNGAAEAQNEFAGDLDTDRRREGSK
jgi:hypothetical protein